MSNPTRNSSWLICISHFQKHSVCFPFLHMNMNHFSWFSWFFINKQSIVIFLEKQTSWFPQIWSDISFLLHFTLKPSLIIFKICYCWIKFVPSQKENFCKQNIFPIRNRKHVFSTNKFDHGNNFINQQ